MSGARPRAEDRRVWSRLRHCTNVLQPICRQRQARPPQDSASSKAPGGQDGEGASHRTPGPRKAEAEPGGPQAVSTDTPCQSPLSASWNPRKLAAFSASASRRGGVGSAVCHSVGVRGRLLLSLEGALEVSPGQHLPPVAPAPPALTVLEES